MIIAGDDVVLKGPPCYGFYFGRVIRKRESIGGMRLVILELPSGRAGLYPEALCRRVVDHENSPQEAQTPES